MAVASQTLGRWGETLAAVYLIRRGYVILETNFRTPYGELDLVGYYQHRLIFVEVKTRSSGRFGWPEESITAKKQQHLRDSAAFFLQNHPEMEMDWQIDVVAIRTTAQMRGNPEIHHLENAVF